MPDLTPISDAIDGSPLPVQFDTQLQLITKKAEFDMLPHLRYYAWMKGNMTMKKNVKLKSIMWDRDDSTPPWSLKRWSQFTPVTAQIYNFRRRSEMLFDVKSEQTATEELTRLETADQQFRDTNQMNVEGMLEWFPKLINDMLCQGDGALYTENGHPCQNIFGYQSALPITLTGDYAKVPVATNLSAQHQIVDGDTGPSSDFHDDAITMIKRLLRATQVDIAKRRHRADVMFTNLDTLGVVEEAWDALGMARVQFVNGKSPEGIDVGVNAFSFYGVPLLEDETITDPRIYALETKSWEIYSSYPEMFQLERNRKINNVVGDDKFDIAKYRLSQVCRYKRPNGVLHYDA